MLVDCESKQVYLPQIHFVFDIDTVYIYGKYTLNT